MAGKQVPPQRTLRDTGVTYVGALSLNPFMVFMAIVTLGERQRPQPARPFLVGALLSVVPDARLIYVEVPKRKPDHRVRRVRLRPRRIRGPRTHGRPARLQRPAHGLPDIFLGRGRHRPQAARLFLGRALLSVARQ